MVADNYYPIVLIRGYAMRAEDIERASNQAFLGFEEGSTKIRQDAAGEIHRFFFESVVMRLVQDHGYVDCYRDNRIASAADGHMPTKSIWTCRYYDLAAKSLGGERLPIETYAKDLRRTILAAREATCKTSAERAAFKAHLVAHSQGGLVARCYLQNLCRGAPGLSAAERAELELTPPQSDPLVASFFSYGVPHNGIELLGVNVPDLGDFSILQARNFNRKAIRKFLDLPPADGDERVNDLAGAIDADRVFCLIGTNWKDFDQASRHFTRETSDGLVMCANAYTVDRTPGGVKHSPRAYISRAHGGPFGMTNSEEGYQNLQRFLFGDFRVDVQVALDAVRVPQSLFKKLKPRQLARANYCVDVIASIRGQQVALHERRTATSSAVRFPVEYRKPPDDAVLPSELFDLHALTDGDPQTTVASVFLRSKLSADTAAAKSGPMEFAVQIGIDVPAFEIDRQFWFDQHIEGMPVLRERLHLRVDPAQRKVFHALMRHGDVRPRVAVPETFLSAPGALFEFRGEVPFGPANLKPGEAKGRFIIRVRERAPL